MIIQITHDDIKNGNATKDKCPITVGLQRVFGSKNISVCRDYIRFYKKGSKKWQFISLPITAKNFILNYDKYWPEQPFSFELSSKDIKLLKGTVK